MKRVLNINLIVLLFICLFTACETDNYDEPAETVYGKIIDINTGEPLRTAVYDCMIQLEDYSWSDTPNPMRFSSRPDGTYTNTKVFAGEYVVTPVFGPFLPIEGKRVQIKGSTEVNFEVEPYLNVDIVKFEHSGNKVVVDFTIKSSNDTYKILDAQIFTSYTDFVSDGSRIDEYLTGYDFSETPNTDVYTTTHRIEIEDLKSGRSYYFRAGARVDDPYKKYNYSKVTQKVTVP